jgi:hypothetical protein
MAIIDVFNGSLDFESRNFQTAGFVLPPVPLLIHQQCQALLEAERLISGSSVCRRMASAMPKSFIDAVSRLWVALT